MLSGENRMIDGIQKKLMNWDSDILELIMTNAQNVKNALIRAHLINSQLYPINGVNQKYMQLGLWMK